MKNVDDSGNRKTLDGIEAPGRLAQTQDTAHPTIFVIDDEPHLRKLMAKRLRNAGYEVETFASALDFIRRPKHEGCGCILLDIQMPGMSGVELQEEISKADYAMPIIFVTACADLATCVTVMKKGAENFLTKPFCDKALQDAVRAALEKDRTNRLARASKVRSEKLIATLTPREHEVMRLLLAGRLNKQIAADLGIAEITAKVHRGQIMKKLGVTSMVELMRIINPETGNPDQRPHPVI